MRPPVNGSSLYRATFAALTAVVATSLASVAAAQEGAPPKSLRAGEDQWVPSFAIIGGAQFQEQEATVESNCALGGPTDNIINDCSFVFPGSPASLRPSSDDSDWDVTPFVGAIVELATPAITQVPGRPRFFVYGEALATFASKRQIASEGDATGVTVPPERTNLNQLPADGLLGQGSRTRSEVRTWAYGAGIGVSFPFELLGRRLNVKPSAGWYRYQVEIDGIVLAGVKDDVNTQPGEQFGRNLREVTLAGEDRGTYHGIGPGLELDLEAGRFGPIGVSVYAGGHAYKILGDRDLSFSSQVTLAGNGLPQDTYTGNWSFEVDPWLFRAGAGIRFHWLGSQ